MDYCVQKMAVILGPPGLLVTGRHWLTVVPFPAVTGAPEESVTGVPEESEVGGQNGLVVGSQGVCGTPGNSLVDDPPELEPEPVPEALLLAEVVTTFCG